MVCVTWPSSRKSTVLFFVTRGGSSFISSTHWQDEAKQVNHLLYVCNHKALELSLFPFLFSPFPLPPCFHFFLSTNNHTSLFYFSFISIPLLSSSLVNHILCEAFKKDIKFHVIVVDSRPRLEGREALRRLVQRGIRCTYVLISAVSYILPEVIMKSQQC